MCVCVCVCVCVRAWGTRGVEDYITAEVCFPVYVCCCYCYSPCLETGVFHCLVMLLLVIVKECIVLLLEKESARICSHVCGSRYKFVFMGK